VLYFKLAVEQEKWIAIARRTIHIWFELFSSAEPEIIGFR